MKPMTDTLFVYGTLTPDRAPGEIADAVNTLTPLGPGTIRGRLYDFGDYPGVILDDSSSELVKGQVFGLPPDPDVLARLDEYEEYRPGDPERSLFDRRRTQVTLPNGSRRLCWVYVYNQGITRRPA